MIVVILPTDKYPSLPKALIGTPVPVVMADDCTGVILTYSRGATKPVEFHLQLDEVEVIENFVPRPRFGSKPRGPAKKVKEKKKCETQSYLNTKW
jgi:hypothetical protein